MRTTTLTPKHCLLVAFLVGSFSFLSGQQPLLVKGENHVFIPTVEIERIRSGYGNKKDTNAFPGFGTIRLNNTIKSSARPLAPAGVQAFDYPLNDCFTYTFKLSIGPGDGETLVKETFTSTEGITYLVGQVFAATGEGNGLIQRLDHQATISWSKSLVHPGRNTVVQSIRELASGNLVVVGTTELPDETDKKIFVAELEKNGNLAWSRSLAYGNYSGMGISPTPSNGIAFCGNDDSTIVYGNLDNAGNLNWLKKIRLLEKGAVVGMTANDYNSWYIAYTGIDSLRRVGILMQFNWVDGAIAYINKFGGKTANSDFIFHDLELINIRPRVSGIYSVNNGPYKLFKLTGNVTGQYESIQTFETPGIDIDITARTSLTPWAETIAFSPSNSAQEVYAVKMITEANPETIVHWMKKFDGVGIHELVNIERTFDGGFLLATNRQMVTGTQEYILKMDSIGRIKDCEGKNFDISSTMGYNGTVATLHLSSTSVSASILTNAMTANDIVCPANFECKNLSCPPVVPEDPCISSFARRYRGANFCDLGINMLVEDQNRITMAAIMRDNPYDGTTDKAALIILNETGKLQERKTITLGNSSVITKLLRLRDGNLLALGNSSYRSSFTGMDTGYITISKFSPTLQLIWNQSFPFYGPYSAIYGIEESEDGSIFVNYIEGKNFCENLSLLKLNSQGGLEWVKDYQTDGQCVFGYVGSMTQDKDHIYLTNWATPDVILLKIQKTTGALSWSRGYRLPNTDQTLVARNLSFIGENLVVQGIASNPAISKDVVMLIDKNNGIIKTARSFSQNTGVGYYQMLVTRNHELVLTTGNYFYSSFLRLDSNLNILYSKKAQITASGTSNIREGLDGSIYDLGYFSYQNVYTNDISLKKYSFDGLLGSCFVDTLALTTETQPVIQANINTIARNQSVNLESLPYWEHFYSLQENSLLCSKAATCDMLDIDGPRGICDTLDYTIHATRNVGCNAPVYFSYSSTDFKLISRTDSSITVRFLQSGTTRIKARIFTGCVWIEDSLDIYSSIIYDDLDLGPDTVLCTANTLQINARKGYTSYLWNDGSVDSVFTVSSPGEFYVDVSDACGNYFSDTVIVTAAPPIPFDIGTNRSKCNDDTLHIIAPGGFLNYAWGPAYNISSANSQQVFVQPDRDTIYFVKAEKTLGCFAYDTIRVRVYQSPPIDLGPDKSFCNGDSAVLDAGNGFTAYSWRHGATGQQITVFSPGDYAVTGTTMEGCKSADTLRIIDVWNNPQVTLNSDSTLCIGNSRTLQAGNFSSYLWQDGSTSPEFTITNTGTYYVTVWDNNQCMGSDTTRITKLLPLPANFLPADTLICNYGKLDIQAKADYQTYSWSNNAVTSSITVTTPGIYWLQVTDANSCTGKDSVVIDPKDCLTGFYIPTAFTPNNDGLNDFFKPVIGGNLKRYQFNVFNRWGQVVFTTTEINKGWNGIFNGTPQDSHVFAWTCTYQLEGAPMKSEKGTVVLMR